MEGKKHGDVMLRPITEFDPEQIKRREYMGIGALIAGVVCLIAGFVGMIFLTYIGLALLTAGTAATITGVHVLSSIPNVLALPYESWT